jgi:hypothetical protein
MDRKQRLALCQSRMKTSLQQTDTKQYEREIYVLRASAKAFIAGNQNVAQRYKRGEGQTRNENEAKAGRIQHFTDFLGRCIDSKNPVIWFLRMFTMEKVYMKGRLNKSLEAKG